MENQDQISNQVISEQAQSAPIIVHHFPWLKVIAIALIIGIPLGLGGYILGAKRSQPIQQQIVQKLPTPTPAPNPTANWKIYNNSQYNYSVNYPINWQLSDCDKNGQTVNVSSNIFDCKKVIPDNSNITIIVVPGDKVQSYIADRKGLGTVTTSTISLGGVSGTDLSLAPVSTAKTESVLNKSREIFVVRNNMTYVISLFVFNDFNSENQIFNQILSTFKFTQ